MEHKCDKCGQLAALPEKENITCIRGACNGKMKPLTLKTDAGAKLACSDGLFGLTAEDTRCIHEALGLMNSMILSGEQHTLKSEKVLYDARVALGKAK